MTSLHYSSKFNYYNMIAEQVTILGSLFEIIYTSN